MRFWPPPATGASTRPAPRRRRRSFRKLAESSRGCCDSFAARDRTECSRELEGRTARSPALTQRLKNPLKQLSEIEDVLAALRSEAENLKEQVNWLRAAQA